ncbi:MAG: hypothetical protein DRO00_08670 [Thermoproteota archaeon]|nr:MAG: hypothetical protein DRO00_08670 [Candidatus Korarchaeota archaeon]
MLYSSLFFKSTCQSISLTSIFVIHPVNFKLNFSYGFKVGEKETITFDFPFLIDALLGGSASSQRLADV